MACLIDTNILVRLANAADAHHAARGTDADGTGAHARWAGASQSNHQFDPEACREVMP
jgi:hypothetical protein